MSNEKKMSKGKKVFIGIGIYVLVAIVAVAIISQTDAWKETGDKTAEPAQSITQPEIPEKNDSKRIELSQQEKILNPLIMAAERNKKRVVQNGSKQKVGLMLVVEVPTEELKTVTAKQLVDFWQYSVTDEFLFATVVETDEQLENYTGRGFVVHPFRFDASGNDVLYGEIDTDTSDYIHFGGIRKTLRTFFYVRGEDFLFQYFDASDDEDAPLNEMKSTDVAFGGLGL